MNSGGAIQQQGERLTLQLHIQPRARADQFCGLHGDAIKLRITAPPVDGRANQHLIALLAEWFAVPRERVVLLSGSSGRSKRVAIDRPGQLPPWLGPLLEP